MPILTSVYARTEKGLERYIYQNVKGSWLPLPSRTYF